MRRFSNILYVVEENAPLSAAAVARVVELAETNQARLNLLCIADRPRLGPFAGTVSTSEYEARVKGQELERLGGLLAPYADRLAIDVEVRFGSGFIEVIRDVLRNGRDLVVKTTGGGGMHSFLFGGTDQHLLRKCPCPVWIMQPAERPRYKRILAAVDFDPWDEEGESSVDAALNRLILELGSTLAIADHAELHIVHVWESATENVIRVFGSDLSEADAAANLDRERHWHRERLEDLDRSLAEWVGREGHDFIAPRLHLRRGNAREVIPALAAELKVDLVVMGTVSRTGIAGLIIGNTAEVILNNIDCAVLAVKPEGFVTPVEPAS
jgi:nucleotide-binding universal stress UspA family protein